jgi:hypothetical protein
MEPDSQLCEVIVVTGEDEIWRLLSHEGAIVYPAYCCRYDGFVNDVFSEYANPSIVRPRSVREAQLQSVLEVSFFHEAGDLAADHPLEGHERLYHSSVPARLFKEPGSYYVGWTMYDRAGEEEGVTVWLGARKVAYVRSEEDDNRLHLYVLKQPFYIDDGERLRLITDPTSAAYRFEHIVLLPFLPEACERGLRISDISIEADPVAPGGAAMRLNWRTSAPARCSVECGGLAVQEDRLLQNHCVVLPQAKVSSSAQLRIWAVDHRGRQASAGPVRLAELAPGGSGKARAGRIPFRICNEAGEPAAAWPVTWGFPFPRGALWDLRNLQVRTADGRPLETQKRVQASWEDGSVRWALLDMQVDMPVEGLELVLEYGPHIDDPVPTGITLQEDAAGVVVDAGTLRLTLRRDAYAFPCLVEWRAPGGITRVLGDASIPAIQLVGRDGKLYDRAEVEELLVEECGPLRAVVKVSVRHVCADGAALFRSVLRLTAYRNKPFLRVQHTFENDNLSELFTQVRSLTLHAAVPGALERLLVDSKELYLPTGPVGLLQYFDDEFRVTQGVHVLFSGDRAPGWFAACGDGATIGFAMRDLWQNYPKGWVVERDGLSIGICPDIFSVSYPSGGLEEVRSFFYLQDGSYRLKRGMARTHDMFFSFGEDVEQALAAKSQLLCQPLVRVDPHVFVETGVLSPFCVRGDGGAEEYDRWVEQALAVYEADREETRAYGMLNYGDWFGERRSNWGDMEYDTPYGFILEYLRGGSSRFFALGWQAAWHLADVDTCHHHPDPRLAGRQYLHSIGHVGDYYPEAYIPGAISQEAMSWSHTWVEGLYLYSLLTGERRLLEVAERTMAALAGEELNHYDFTNCRECGWPLRHLMGAYQATGRRWYLNGARIIVERVLERQRPTGGWERMLVPGHCFHVPPRHMGNAGFMVGVLLAALKRYHEETLDQAVGKAIVDAAHYLVRSMWVPEQNAFRYTSCPQSKVDPELNAQILEGIGYAWRLSKSEKLAQILSAALTSCLTSPRGSGTPPVGKDISMRMRSMPFIMRDAVESLSVQS